MSEVKSKSRKETIIVGFSESVGVEDRRTEGAGDSRILWLRMMSTCNQMQPETAQRRTRFRTTDGELAMV